MKVSNSPKQKGMVVLMTIGIGIKPIMHIYPSPQMNTAYSDQLLHGMTVTILKKLTHCYHIRTYYGYEGYIRPQNLRILSPVQVATLSTRQHLVMGSYCPVLLAPNIHAPTIIFLPRGSYIKVIDTQTAPWIKIELGDFSMGYLHQNHIDSVIRLGALTGNQLRQSLCYQGKLYLGSSYLMGGKSPLGIDCSGFCSQIYLNHQKIIHRDSGWLNHTPDNMTIVREISEKDLLLGDLIYFKGHIALYLGQKNYIHSNATSGGVSINSLSIHSPIYRPDLADSITHYGSIFR